MKVTYKPNEQGLERFLQQYCEDKLPAVAITLEGKVKTECPIKTGALQTSIKREVDVPNKTVFVGSDLDYSIWVNLGTRKQAPNDFMMRGLIQTADDITKYMGEKK